MSRPASDAATFVLFEPLSAAAGRAPDDGFQLKVVPPAEPGPAPPDSLPHAHAPASPASTSGQPVVTLQREGDKVTGIRITCVCGQIIELACAY